MLHFLFANLSSNSVRTVLQILILVAAALITTVTNKLLYYFALYTNHLERYVLYTSAHLLKWNQHWKASYAY